MCCKPMCMRSEMKRRFALKALSSFEQRFELMKEKNPHQLKKNTRFHTQFSHPGRRKNKIKRRVKRKFTSLFSTCCSINCAFWCINEVGSLHSKRYWGIIHLSVSFEVWPIGKYPGGLTLLNENCNLGFRFYIYNKISPLVLNSHSCYSPADLQSEQVKLYPCFMRLKQHILHWWALNTNH